MPESHSETTKPLNQEEIAEIEAWPEVEQDTLVARLLATIRSLQARNRDLTVQIVNDDERSRFAAALLARDERIGALSDTLQEVRDTHELWSPRWSYGHSPMRMQRDEDMEQRIDALLKEADDG